MFPRFITGSLCFFLLLHILRAQEPGVPPPLPLDTLDRTEAVEAEEPNPYDWAGDGTGISGVYEAVIGVRDLEYAIRYYSELGYRLTSTGFLSKLAAENLYGVPSAVKAYRLQNGNTDSHGLIRLLVWEKPSGTGIGYTEPGAIGSRMTHMLTVDVLRLHDIYADARRGGEAWLVSPLVRRPLLGDETGRSFFERPVADREFSVFSEWGNHLFAQRYGYTVPGLGNVHMASRLGTSEVIQHDLFVRLDSLPQLAYLTRVLGLLPEDEPASTGDWQTGMREHFFMKPGEAYLEQRFVSPNNISGKLRFLIPLQPKMDLSARQRPGFTGVTAHTFYTPFLDQLWKEATKAQLRPTPILPNEFGERCFVFRGPEGNTWQIIERLSPPVNEPIYFYNLQLFEE